MPSQEIPGCGATPAELVEQRDRLARLAPQVLGVQRARSVATVLLAEGFDRTVLDEMLETERRCCPFFRFDFDESARRLTMSVSEPEHEAALEAVASALGTQVRAR